MLKRKDKILISALELLREEGINGITTKKLAKSQNVTEPALYRQYKNKQEIINGILQEYVSYDERIEKTIRQSSLKGKEAVLFYVNRYGELYQSYVEITTVMYSMDLYFYEDESKDFMRDILNRRLTFLEELIASEYETFSLAQKFTAQEIASMINGLIFSQVYEWRIFGQNFILHERLNSFVERIL